MSKDYSFSKKFVEGEAKSNSWNLLYYGAISVNSFIIIYFLSVYEYGFYQLILSVMAIAESLTAGFVNDLVFSNLSRFLGRGDVSVAKRLFGEYAILKMGLALILGMALFLGAGIIADYYGQAIANFIKIVSVALIFRVGISTMNIFFQGAVYFSALASPVVGEGIKFLAVIAFVSQGNFSILEVLIAYVIGHFAAFIFSAVHFARLYQGIFSGVIAVRKFVLKDLIKVHGIWVFWRYLLSRIGNNIRPWIIKVFLGTEAVGFYSFARNLIAIIVRLLPLGTLGVLFARETEDKERFRYIFARVIKYSIFLSFSFFLTALLILPPVLSWLFPKYDPALPLFKIMAGIIFLYGFYKILRMVLIAFQEQKALAIRSFDESVLAPLILLILLPFLGITGAALEWLVTYFITTILFYAYLVRKYEFLRLRPKDIFKIDKYDRELFIKVYRIAYSFMLNWLKR